MRHASALTELGSAQRSRRGRVREPFQGARLIVLLLGVTMAFSAVALVPRPAVAAGKIVVSDAEWGSYGSEKELNTALKKQGKTTFKGDGSWNLNMMIFLGTGAGADKINIVYYDMSKRPPEQVNFNEIGVKPDQKIVQVNGIAISKDMGFVKGHKYEVRATRIVGGKEKVYAKTSITLK